MMPLARARVVTWGKRGASLMLIVPILVGISCGGGGTKNALKNGLKGSGFEVRGVKGPAHEGQFTVEGENGSKVVLDVVEKGGELLIDHCIEQLSQGWSCTDVPTGQPLEP
jgi:hypothetical protein